MATDEEIRTTMIALINKRDELQAELAACKRDAERYKAALRKYGHHIEGCGHGWSCECGFLECFREKK